MAIWDQQLMLPIFTWAMVWCQAAKQGWKLDQALDTVASSLESYWVALGHTHGIKAALAIHVKAVVARAWWLQQIQGDRVFRVVALADFAAHRCGVHRIPCSRWLLSPLLQPQRVLLVQSV